MMERPAGIEPAPSAWKAEVPPQHLGRVGCLITYRFSPNVSLSRSQHFSQHHPQKGASPTFSPTFLETGATHSNVRNPMFTRFSLLHAKRRGVHNLLGRQKVTPINALCLQGICESTPNFSPNFGGECARFWRRHHPNWMLITIKETARRLGWHRTTVWRRAQSDPSFPTVVYIGPKSPRINSAELDRWISKSKALNSDFMYVSPDLLQGKARGPQRRTRMTAA